MSSKPNDIQHLEMSPNKRIILVQARATISAFVIDYNR